MLPHAGYLLNLCQGSVYPIAEATGRLTRDTAVRKNGPFRLAAATGKRPFIEGVRRLPHAYLACDRRATFVAGLIK